LSYGAEDVDDPDGVGNLLEDEVETPALAFEAAKKRSSDAERRLRRDGVERLTSSIGLDAAPATRSGAH
jgi:hypothetical protein